MSAIDDFLSTQPAPPGSMGAESAASGPQSVDALLARDATVQSVPPALRAPQVQAQATSGILSSIGAGLGHGFASTMLGVEQLIGRGLQALSPASAPDVMPGDEGAAMLAGMRPLGNALANDAQRGIANTNAQYAPYSAAHPIAAGAGNIGGQIAGTLPTMALGPEYAGLSLGGKLAVGAAQGAAGSAMMPIENPGNDFWTQKAEQAGLGGLLGGATPLVTSGARAAGQGLWNAVRPVVQPTQYVGEGLANAMDQAEAAQAANNIRGAQQFVPGSRPTTAQVAQTPTMVQTEKAAGNMPAFKTAMAQRAVDNNDARWQALMSVAGTPADLQAAQAARDATATPLYNAAHQATANVGPAFMRYAQIPQMQEAMDRANDLASLDASVGRGIAPVWPQQGGSKAINGAALDYTSRALGDMIDEAQRAGATSKAASLAALRGKIDSWTQSYIPGVQQARAAYAAGSVPINTMEAGQAIANGLGTRAMNAGGVPEIQMMPFRSALTSAMKNAPYGIDANALNTLQGIGQDLQRATVSNSIRSPGSDTAYNLAANGWLARQLYGPTFGGAGNVGKAIGALGATALGHPMVGLGILGGGNKIGQIVGNRLQDRLAGLLMDPNAILPFLDARAAASAQGIPGPLMQGLLNYGRPATVNGLLGGFNNSRDK